MSTNSALRRSIVRCLVALAVGLSFSSVTHLTGSAAQCVADQDNRQASPPGEKGGHRSGVCEREAEQLVGQRAVRIGRSVRAPKKLRNVAPKYPESPPGTIGSGMWLGEVLINQSGKIAHVWPIREVQFAPPFPAFNTAIADAIRQWEFEPVLVQRKPVPVCMTVTFNIHWQ